MRKIIQTRKIWLSISGLMVGAAILALAIWGLNFGIDFTGGSLMEVRFTDTRPTISEVQNNLSELNLHSLVIQPVEEKEMILRFQETDEEIHQSVLDKLKQMIAAGQEKSVDISETSTSTTETSAVGANTKAESGVEELRFDSVGPSVGKELKYKSIYAIIAVLFCIVLYIAWSFRKVSKPVASWKYGLAAIIALFHDVLIVTGLFAVLGEFYNVEVNVTFIAGILTVLGYSVNDTIVVFDRIRENLPTSNHGFEDTVNISVNQTLVRSINTSLVTLLALLAIIFFGGSSIRDFVWSLSAGIVVGTYSSIFVASPIVVIWEKMSREKK